jgi:glucosamine kinase
VPNRYNMTYLMGIDGGGSTVRVAIVTPDLSVIVQTRGPCVNPYVVGQEKSTAVIQAEITQALTQAALTPDQISGVGVGIAGTSATGLWEWLHGVVAEIIPQAQIVIRSDVEMALVGANGAHQGVLILAGTGSVAYGINESGEALQVGGWGYVLGDEGSGYWLGLQALQAITRAFDGRDKPTALTHKILGALGLEIERDLLPWLYRGDTKPQAYDIAQLAPVVFDTAANGDAAAQEIVEAAAQELASLGKTVIKRLKIDTPRIAFGGGLLEQSNALSIRLCEILDLPKIPVPRYPPVIGAALLAKLTMEQMDKS